MFLDGRRDLANPLDLGIKRFCLTFPILSLIFRSCLFVAVAHLDTTRPVVANSVLCRRRAR